MIGVHNPTPKLQSLLSQEKLKLRTANLADTFTGSKHKPMKNFGEKGAWGYPGTTQIFWVPSIFSGTGKATNFKFVRYIHRVHPNKSPLKILGKKKRGRIQGLPKLSLISGTGKAAHFKFCTHILSIDRNKSALQISGKRSRGRSQDSPNISEHPYTGRITRSSLR